VETGSRRGTLTTREKGQPWGMKSSSRRQEIKGSVYRECQKRHSPFGKEHKEGGKSLWSFPTVCQKDRGDNKIDWGGFVSSGHCTQEKMRYCEGFEKRRVFLLRKTEVLFLIPPYRKFLRKQRGKTTTPFSLDAVLLSLPPSRTPLLRKGFGDGPLKREQGVVLRKLARPRIM